jgi:hypothetical protein
VPSASFAPAAVVPEDDLALVDALVLAARVGVDVEDDVVAGALPVEVVLDELDPHPQDASASKTPTASTIVRIRRRAGDAIFSVYPIVSPLDPLGQPSRCAANDLPPSEAPQRLTHDRASLLRNNDDAPAPLHKWPVRSLAQCPQISGSQVNEDPEA